MRRLFLTFIIIFILFSCNKHLVVQEVDTKNISIDFNIGKSDSTIEAMVKPYRDSIELDMSTLVAVSSAAMVKGKPESKLTNLAADILLNAGTFYCVKQKLDIHPIAAFVNYGGLRASLPQGNITVQHIFELMPFENEIVMIKISGESFMMMAEKIAARGGEGVSGIKLGIRNGMVSSLITGNKPFNKESSYWLVTNDYIANGGDQMSMFNNPEERINTGLKFRDVLIQVLSDDYKKNGIIDVKEDGRIFNEQ